jgi:hypothetical protein
LNTDVTHLHVPAAPQALCHGSTPHYVLKIYRHFENIRIANMLTPDQFRVNEVWIAIRVNEAFGAFLKQ